MELTPLVTPAELLACMRREEPLVVIDTRSPALYTRAHLPGATNIHQFFTYLATSTPEGLRDLQQTFAGLLGAAGVGGDETVVIYEDAMHTGYGQSCRGWFLLKYLGHPRVRILHGGLQAWRAAGLELTAETPEPATRTFDPRPDASWMLTRTEMLSGLGDTSIVKLDVRDAEEWTGESSSPYGKDFAPRKGRIPGAVWLEWHRLMNEDSGVPLFRSPEEIRAMCAEVGVREDSSVYLYCFKGARASNSLVALQEAGIRGARMYLGSWNEWSRDPRLPIDDRVLSSPQPAA